MHTLDCVSDEKSLQTIWNLGVCKEARSHGELTRIISMDISTYPIFVLSVLREASLSQQRRWPAMTSPTISLELALAIGNYVLELEFEEVKEI